MNPPALPRDFHRDLANWTRRPPATSPGEARGRVVARLRPSSASPRSRLLVATAAAVTLAGIWLAARADRFHVGPPPFAHGPSASPSPPMVVMRLSSGTTLYVTLPIKR